METILFELFPAQSHHLMAFKMAKLLKDAGYRVIFGSVPEMQEIVQRHGFDFQSVKPWVVQPLGHKLLLKKKGVPFPDKKERLEEVRKNLDIFNQQIMQRKPDVVLLDRHSMVSKSMFYKKLGVKVILVSPMPDPEPAPNVPPFSSRFFPRENWLSKKYISSLWFSEYLKRRLRIFKYQMLYPSLNDLTIYRQLASAMGKNPKDVKIPHDGSGYYTETTPRIILSATDLDFPRPEIKGVYNIGPLIDLPADESKSTDARYEAMKSIVTKGNSAVIYCSLGMLVDFCTDQKIKLYQKIKKVAILAPTDFFVLCTGDDLDNSNLLPLPPNLFVFKSLPQKDLLKYCTIMINHGGLNSITECIFNEVPVIAYPPSHMADHSSNSARGSLSWVGIARKSRSRQS
ncbi:MAG: glycosyltransferase [Prolixibacteraceae bacterium]